MSIFIRVGLLFLPFAWLITGGIYDRYMLFLGSAGVLFTVVHIKKLRSLTSCWPSILGTIIWIAASVMFSWQEEDNIYPNKSAFFGCAYGLGAGICLAHYYRMNRPDWTLSAYLAVGLGLVILAVYVLRVGNVEIEASVENGNAVRSLKDTDAVQYLRFFTIGNPMIWLVPYITFGMGFPLLLLFPVRWFHYPFILVAAAGGLLVTLKLQTRMGFVAVALASAIVGSAIFIHGSGHMRGARKWTILSFLGILFCVGIGVALTIPEVQSFIDRLQSSTRDSRLDLWAEAWSAICQRPFGGGFQLMGLIVWAHNLFLDFALINGIAGLASVLLIYVPALWTLASIIRIRHLMNNPLVVILCNGFLSTFVIALINPPFVSFTVFCYIFTGFGIELLSKSSNLVPGIQSDPGARIPSGRLSPVGAWERTTLGSESH